MGRIMRRTSAKFHRKAKRSYTLSPESVKFLEGLRKQRGASSISAILDEILQEMRRKEKRAVTECAIGEYYDSLSGDEVKQDAQWGEFAFGEFPAEDGA